MRSQNGFEKTIKSIKIYHVTLQFILHMHNCQFMESTRKFHNIWGILVNEAHCNLELLLADKTIPIGIKEVKVDACSICLVIGGARDYGEQKLVKLHTTISVDIKQPKELF